MTTDQATETTPVVLTASGPALSIELRLRKDEDKTPADPDAGLPPGSVRFPGGKLVFIPGHLYETRNGSKVIFDGSFEANSYGDSIRFRNDSGGLWPYQPDGRYYRDRNTGRDIVRHIGPGPDAKPIEPERVHVSRPGIYRRFKDGTEKRLADGLIQAVCQLAASFGDAAYEGGRP